MAYCNSTTDLQREFSRIEEYEAKEVVKNWTNVSGDLYYKFGTGYPEMVFWDGVQLTAVDEYGDLDPSTYFYRTTDDKLFIYLPEDDTGKDPDDGHIVEVGIDWATLKTDAINEASALIDARLNRAFPTPILPRSSRTHTTDTYDPDLVRACASLACALIILRVDPNDINGKMLHKYAINPTPEPGEALGIIDQYLNGTLVFQDQITAREVGNWNITPYASNTVTYSPELFGTYKGSTYKEWRIQIDTGGAPGTGTYKVSFDGGTNWDLTLQDMKDSDQDTYRMYIADGVYVKWPNTTWVINEYWDVKLYPLSDTVTVKSFGSIKGTRL
jgi:hypothetical protein